MTLDLTISRRTIVRVVWGIVLALTIVNLLHQVSWDVLRQDYVRLGWKFDVAGDQTVPTWYASASLLFCALLFGLTAVTESRAKGAYACAWAGLSLIFTLLSIDETAGLHEWLSSVMDSDRASLVSSYLHYPWVIVGVIAVAVFALAYLPFFLALPMRFRGWFALAAVIYLGGALGVEMINAHIEVARGATSFRYQLGAAFEELCEMVGVLVLIHALLLHLESKTTEVRLSLRP